jgi:hypothetical protein
MIRPEIDLFNTLGWMMGIEPQQQTKNLTEHGQQS